MDFFDRRFFAGVAAGCGLALVAGVVGVGLLVLGFDRVMPGIVRKAMTLNRPVFPDPNALPALGTADPTYRLRGLDGETTTLAAFAGRPVFLNFWATWCAPCVAELPGIDRLRDQVGDGVVFVLVSEEPLDVVREFVTSRGIESPVYVTEDPRPRVFDEPGIPLTYVLDRTGTVVLRHRGAAPWDDGSCRDFLLAIP